jgi:hypothetical protein
MVRMVWAKATTHYDAMLLCMFAMAGYPAGVFFAAFCS